MTRRLFKCHSDYRTWTWKNPFQIFLFLNDKAVEGQMVKGFKQFFFTPRHLRRVAIQAPNSVGGKRVNALSPILKSQLRLISIVIKYVKSPLI